MDNEVKKYRVKEEYYDSWTHFSIPEEGLITDMAEIEQLAKEWETTVEALLEQVEEI